MKNIIKLFGVSIITLFVYSSPAYAELQVTLSGGGKTSVDNTVNTTLNSKIDLDLSSEEEENTSSRVDTNTSIDVSLKTNVEGGTITTAGQVSSETDLKLFTSNMSSQNESVAKVEVSSENSKETEVEVVYKHKGKFLGFIPVTIKSTTDVSVEENSKVEIESSLSWWSFLVTGVNYNKKDIESRLENNTKVQVNTKLNASAQARAEIVESVVAELQASAEAEGSANLR